MACYRPIDAFQRVDGGPLHFGAEPGREMPGDWRPVRVPCNNCIGCKQEYAQKWAVRCMHEAEMHADNSFVTLTFRDDSIRNLEYDVFQDFMVRLRKRRHDVRYFVAGEYGGRNGRPHFHACLFGAAFPDMYAWAKAPSGFMQYRSAELEGVWPHGFALIGTLTKQSAQYCAKYAAKALTSKWQVSRETGEVRPPEFVHMSTRPAIGLRWLQRYHSDVYKAGDGSVVLPDGVKVKAPRYYDKKFELMAPLEMDAIKESRKVRALVNTDDDTAARLKVREEVTLARLKFHKKESGL